MNRVAIFVDAGYLFAAGATSLTGSNKPRQNLTLKKAATIEKLKTVAFEKAPNAELLRIYWYDGASGYKGPTSEQSDLAYRDDIKIRLGFINSMGQQKGVDSLIVTDLIELARNRSIVDAVLLSGDEDVRVGVQMAQNFGVRVHLIGIEPCKESQSNQLLQESDTCSKWSNTDVQDMLEYNDPQKIPPIKSSRKKTVCDDDPVTKAVEQYFSGLSAEKADEIINFISVNKSIPPEHDGQLLGECRKLLGRTLDKTETREMRILFRKLIGG